MKGIQDHRVRRLAILLNAFLTPASLLFFGFAFPAIGYTQNSVKEKAARNSGQASRGSVPGQPTAPNPQTAAQLAALPQPLPATLTKDINVAERSKSILGHLSDVIRFYRMTVTPIQKTGEPSDVLYGEQAQSTATQIAQLAFQSARAEASLLSRIQNSTTQQNLPAADGEEQRLRNAQLQVTQKVQDLQIEQQTIEKQMGSASPKSRTQLRDRLDDIRGQMELAEAETQALSKVFGLSTAKANSGLEGDIDKLQQAVPEVIDSKVKPVPNTLQSIGSYREAGVISQGQILFQLVSTRRAIDDRISELKKLHQQALELRTPLENILRATLKAGGDLETGASQLTGTNSSNDLSTRKTYDQLTDAFKTISGVSIPISQEILLIEQAQGNLISWRGAVDSERVNIIHSLLVRLAIIAIALAAVIILGEVWRRAVTRYVEDLRRRRQLLVIRRMVIGFLSGMVILLGAVTQFSSLATFAGFVTAGLAVGLQTVLLSVAAYFFIVGRYGVRVGDRITVANVTGDVVEVGLVRFYVMELAGTGNVLHPTGRIAVFANSILFQSGTPLYKQIPGTNYAWHEVSLKLKTNADYEPVLHLVQKIAEGVYSTYKQRIERQHAEVEAWMDTSLPPPRVESRLELAEGLKFTVLYPVLINQATEIDQQMVEALLKETANNQAIAQAVEGSPVVTAIVKA